MRNRLLMILFSCAVLLTGCSSASVSYDAASDSNGAVTATAAASIAQAPVAASADTEAAVEYNVVTSGMSCFTFTRQENVYTDNNGTQLLQEQLDQAFFASGDENLNEWVNGLLAERYASDVRYSNELLNYAQKDLTQLGADFYTYSHYVSLGVARHDSQVASLLSLSSVYSGGAHPNSVQTSYNLDLVNQCTLRLEDVIYEESAPQLCQLVQQKISEKFASIGDGALYDNYNDTIQNVMNYGNLTSYWYFNNDGLVVFFNQYELAPYAAGIIKVTISYDELDGILLEEYYPQDSLRSKTTGVVELEEPASDTTVFTAKLGEGESRYFTVNNILYNVQVSEVYFVEDTPVGQTMVLSADYIDESVTLEVIGDLTDPNRAYAVTFKNLFGADNVLYIRTDGTSYNVDVDIVD